MEETTSSMPETNSIQMQGGMLRVMSRYKPSKIKAYLDTRVIGQEEAKKNARRGRVQPHETFCSPFPG